MSRIPPFSLIKIYNLFDAIKAKKLYGKISVIVPTHMRGEELYTQMGFLVRTILADRYIHRRELEPLERSSSEEYEIEKILRIFLFYGELSSYRDINFWEK